MTKQGTEKLCVCKMWTHTIGLAKILVPFLQPGKINQEQIAVRKGFGNCFSVIRTVSNKTNEDVFRCLTQQYKRPRSIFILFIIRLVNGSCSVAPFLLLVGQWRAGGCGRIKTIISFIYDKTCRHFHVYSRACNVCECVICRQISW